jgi:hypothetical protein
LNVIHQQVSGPPVAAGDVHVTGRRVLTIIVDGLVLGVLFWVMSLLFGTSSAESGAVSASLGTLGTLAYTILAFAYFASSRATVGRRSARCCLA